MSVRPSICTHVFGVRSTMLSSPRANYLKFIHKVIDHKRKAKFNFRHFNFFLSGVYVPVYFKLEANASMSYRHILSFLWLWLLFDINATVVWLSPYQKVAIKNDNDMFLQFMIKSIPKSRFFLSQFVQTNIFMLTQNLFCDI